MIERLSSDYNQGYTKAMQDMQEIFSYIQEDLKTHHKNLSPNMCKKLISCCLTNRERIRESQRGFIRYNSSMDDFEFFEPWKANKSTKEAV